MLWLKNSFIFQNIYFNFSFCHEKWINLQVYPKLPLLCEEKKKLGSVKKLLLKW